jgi:hypothetical protein
VFLWGVLSMELRDRRGESQSGRVSSWADQG